MAELTAWGKSMYGGWYANFWLNGEHTGIHEYTRADLCRHLSRYGIHPTAETRCDNLYK